MSYWPIFASTQLFFASTPLLLTPDIQILVTTETIPTFHNA